MGDVGLAIQRAEEKTENMKARAGAIDELLASGALEDYSGPRDDIQAELDRVGPPVPGVDLELERMKAELGMARRRPSRSTPRRASSRATAAGRSRPQQQAQHPHQPGEGQ